MFVFFVVFIDDESGYDYRNGLINRIRNLFERALNYNDNDSDHHNHNGSIDWILGRSLAHCPIIWRLFIRFEVSRILIFLHIYNFFLI